MYALLADVVLGVHALFVAYNLFGLAAIWVGAFLRCSFVRNRWFRGTHLAAMGVVVGESLLGIFCPLTRWEFELRRLAGVQGENAGSFMHHWAQELLYFDISPYIFTVTYFVFFALMLATVWLVPVHWNRRNRS